MLHGHGVFQCREQGDGQIGGEVDSWVTRLREQACGDVGEEARRDLERQCALGGACHGTVIAAFLFGDGEKGGVFVDFEVL